MYNLNIKCSVNTCNHLAVHGANPLKSLETDVYCFIHQHKVRRYVRTRLNKINNTSYYLLSGTDLLFRMTREAQAEEVVNASSRKGNVYYDQRQVYNSETEEFVMVEENVLDDCEDEDDSVIEDPIYDINDVDSNGDKKFFVVGYFKRDPNDMHNLHSKFAPEEEREYLRPVDIAICEHYGVEIPSYQKIHKDNESEYLYTMELIKDYRSFLSTEAIRTSRMKQVYRYNYDGELTDTFESVLEASKKLNIPKSTISSICSNSRGQKVGFILSHDAEDVFNIQNYKINKVDKTVEKVKEKRVSNRSKTVYQYNKDNELIATFESATEASKVLNIPLARVSRLCNGKAKEAYTLSYIVK